MKKILLLPAAFAAIAGLTSIRAGAWFKKTHIIIAETAMEILKNDGRESSAKLLRPFFGRFIRGATIPDVKGDCDNGSGLHYYSPINKFGLPNRQQNGYYPNRKGGHSKSACTMMEENYTMAVIFWQNGRYNCAAELLGRAVHFLSDICCVPHTTSRICTGSPKNCHTSYEQTANRLAGRYKAVTARDIYQIYLKLSPREIANRLAELSSRDYDRLVKKGFDKHTSIASEAIPLAQIACAAFINKFAFDAKSGKIFNDSGKYIIKNAGSGLCMKSDFSLDSHGDPFTLRFNQDGSVGFADPDGELICFGKNNDSFKLTLCDKEDGLFRITCCKKYSKALTDVPVLKRAGPAAFKPANHCHYWYIQESS